MRKLLKDLTPNQVYAIQFRLDDGTNKSDWSPVVRFVTAKDLIAPAKVSGLSFVRSGTAFIATWNKTTTNVDSSALADFKDYEVTITAAGVSKVYYVTQERFDLPLEVNKNAFGSPKPTITIEVAARDTSLNINSDKATASSTNESPVAPINFVYQNGINQIMFKWDKSTSDDLKGYRIYVGTSAGTVNTLVWEGNATQYTYQTTTFSDRYFKVCAVDVFDSETFASNTLVAQPQYFDPLDTTPPIAPTWPTSWYAAESDLSNKYALRINVTLSWNANPESDMGSYVIRYKKASDSQWTETTVSGTATTAPPTTVKINNLSPGLSYNFAIAARDKTGNTSAFVNAPSSQTALADTTAPPVPAAPTASSLFGAVRINWNGLGVGSVAMPDDTSSVEVHVSTTNNFTPTAATQVDVMAGVVSGRPQSVILGGLTNGTTYYTKLISVDFAGNRSAASAQVSAVPVSIAKTDINFGARDIGAPVVFYQTAQPTTGMIENDLWFDTDDGNKPYVYKGSTWQSVQDATIAAADSKATTAITAANGKNKIYSQATQPSGGTYIDGDTWFDTANGNRPYVYKSGAWTDARDASIATAQTTATNAATAASTAQNAANNANTLAGTKNKTYIQGTAPTDMSAGDIWIDTANSNQLKRYSGSAWVDGRDTTIATAQAAATSALTVANGKNKTYIQGTSPTGMTSGDIWIDTANKNQLKRYDGSTWVSGRDGTIADAATAASTADGKAVSAQTAANNAATAAGTAQTAANNAQAAANTASDNALAASGLAAGKGKVWYQTTAPTGNANDLWIDTTGGANTPKRYDGSTWVAVTDKTATDAAAAAATANTAAGTAQTTANNAATAASTAQGRANDAHALATTANTTANGKNKVTYSTAVPGSTANAAGDIWFQKDANNVIIGQYEGAGGTTWIAKTIGSAVIANLDAGKITTGTLDAGRIATGSITIGMIKSGDVATPAQVTTVSNAATAAQTAADAAQLSQTQVTNPIFSNWPGTFPVGYIAWTGASTTTVTKETTIKRTSPNALRFNVATTTEQLGLQFTSANTAPLPGTTEYITAEVEFQLVSGSLGQSGFVMDWGNSGGRVTISLFDEVPSPVLGQWYRIQKTFKRPTATVSTVAISGYLMAQWTGLNGGGAVKNIVFDRMSLRSATAEEISTVSWRTPGQTTINGGQITTDSITATQIAADAITASELAANSVVAGNITAGAVTTAAMTANTINGDRISAGTLNADKIVALSITSSQIAAGAIVTDKMTANTINGDRISAGTLNADKIVALSITAGQIATNAITAVKIAAGAITTEKLTIGQIGEGQLLNGGFEEASSTDATLPARWRRNVIYTGPTTGASVLTTTSPIAGSRSLSLEAVPPMATPVSSVTIATTGGSIAASTALSYRVVAENSYGVTVGSTASTVTTDSASTTNSATISWAAIPGATSYRVYGRTSASTLLIASGITGTSYVDTGAITPSGAIPGSNTSFRNGNVLSNTNVQTVPGDVWSVSVKAKGNVAVGSGLYVRITGGSTAGATNVTVNPGIENRAVSTAVTSYEATFTIPAGMLYADVSIFYYGQAMATSAAGTPVYATIGDVVLGHAINSTRIEDGAITTNKVVAGAISAEKLSIGSRSNNMAPNDSFEDLDATGSWVSLWTRDTSAGYAGATYSLNTVAANVTSGTRSILMNAAANNGARVYSELIPSAAGDKVSASAIMKGAAAYAANAYQVFVLCYNTSNALISTLIASTGALTTTFAEASGQVTLPAGTTRIRVGAALVATTVARSMYVGAISVRHSVGSTVIEDGAVITEKIFAGAVTARTVGTNEIITTTANIGTAVIESANIRELNAAKITTGELAAGVRIIAGPSLGTHAEMTSTGFRVYGLNPATGAVDEVVRLGTDTNDYFAVTKSDGSYAATIDDSGRASFADLVVQSDPTFQGQKLFGYHFNKIGAGLVAFGVGTPDRAGIGAETQLFGVTFNSTPGRAYRITISGIRFANSASGYGQGMIWLLRDVNQNNKEYGRGNLISVNGGFNGGYTVVREFYDGLPGGVRNMVMSAAPIGSTIHAQFDGNQPYAMVVEDIGPTVAQAGNTYAVPNSGPPEPARTTYQETIQASWAQTYRQDGNPNTSAGGRLYQGYGDSFNGNQRSLIGFPDLTPRFSGATINNITLFLYAAHWYNNSGGTAILGAHGLSSQPGTFAGAIDPNRMQSGGWPKPGARTIDLTGWGAEWKAGTVRGVVIGPGPNTSTTYYGYFNGPGQSYFPELRINYTK